MKNNIRIYSIAQSISSIGNNLRWFAWPLLVFQITGNGYYLALAGIGDETGAILGSFFSGYFATHCNRKRLMVIIDLILAIASFCMSLLTKENFFFIIPIFFLFGFFGEIYEVTGSIVIDDIKSDKEVRTSYAKVQASIFFTATITVISAGAWISFYSLKSVFVIDAISYFICALSLIFIKITQEKVQTLQSAYEKLKDFIAGYKTTLHEDRYILAVILLVGLVTWGANINYQVTIVYLKSIFGVSDSYMTFWRLAINIGAFAGSMLLLSPVMKKISNYFLVTVGYLLLGLTYLAFPFMPNPHVFLVLYFATVVMGQIAAVSSRAEAVEWVNKESRGRILSFRATFINIMMLFAVLTNYFNLHINNGIYGYPFATFIIILGVIYLFVRRFRLKKV